MAIRSPGAVVGVVMNIKFPIAGITAVIAAAGLAACGSDTSDSATAAPARLDAGGQAGRRDPVAHGSHHRRRARRRLRRGARHAEAHARHGRRRRAHEGRLARLPDHGRQRQVLQARHRLPVRPGRDRPRGQRLQPHGRRQEGRADRLRHRPRQVRAHGQRLGGRQGGREGRPAVLPRRRTLEPLKADDNGTAVLEGTTVKLKQEAADLLNQTFGTDALKAGARDRRRHDHGQHRIGPPTGSGCGGTRRARTAGGPTSA